MPSTKKIWGLFGLVLCLASASCAGAGAGAAKHATSLADGNDRAATSVPAERPQADDASLARRYAGAAEAVAQPASPSASRSALEEGTLRDPSPDTRPGLGTEWGESRSSHVRDVTFVRDSNRPFSVATLHYNDRQGVDAMANLLAQREARRDVAFGGGAVSISIRDAAGDPLEVVHVGDRTQIVGQAGQRYSIVLTNHTRHRFESVVTVDGLDVVNGRPGSAENRGYVLLPFATLEIEGFRQSASAVAAFRFAAVGESYAAQMGAARNVGVIGVALFGERGDPFLPESELRLRDRANPFPADARFARPPRR